MNRLKYIFLLLAAVFLIPGSVLFAQVGNYPMLTDIEFTTTDGTLTMELTFDSAPSAEDIDVKQINYPSRYVVSAAPASKSEELREGVVFQDILSDGSRGVLSIEFYYDMAYDKIGFIAYPNDGLNIKVTNGTGGKINVRYTRTAPEESTLVAARPVHLPPEPFRKRTSGFADLFTLDQAEMHLSVDTESIIREYFSISDDITEIPDDAEEIIASLETGMEGSVNRETNASYRIQVGDKLLLGVAGEPEQEVSVQVRPDGYVSLQIIGDVLVEGKTAEEVRRTVKRQLQPYYNYDILVDVIIIEYTPQRVYLLGKVYDAGVHIYYPGMTLLDVFSNFDQRDADFTKVKLLRGDDVYPVDMEALLAGEVHMNYELEPGDYVVVPALILPRAVIIGKVRIPAQYTFEEGTRLFDMVGMAGGFDDRCDIKNIRVIRLNAGMLESHKCNLRAYQEEGAVDQNILIRHGDIIIVPEVGRPNWDRLFDSFSAINSVTLWGRTNWW